MALSEEYINRMKVLSGQKGTLVESARVDFLKNEFIKRVGRKYDVFAKAFKDGTWDHAKEKDKFLNFQTNCCSNARQCSSYAERIKRNTGASRNIE